MVNSGYHSFWTTERNDKLNALSIEQKLEFFKHCDDLQSAEEAKYDQDPLELGDEELHFLTDEELFNMAYEKVKHSSRGTDENMSACGATPSSKNSLCTLKADSEAQQQQPALCNRKKQPDSKEQQTGLCKQQQKKLDSKLQRATGTRRSARIRKFKATSPARPA